MTMRMSELVPLYVDDADEIVDLTEGDLWRFLEVPDRIRHVQRSPQQAAEHDAAAGTVVLAFVGPPLLASAEPDNLAPVLRRLRPGARAILLIGWPIAELPYHRLLGPLVDARCQLTAVVPLDRPSVHGAHCALVIECVNKILPPRAYLTDIPTSADPDQPSVEGVDDLRTLLRIVNEHVLGDLVARPLRKRLLELEHADAERAKAVAQRAQAEAQRAAAHARASALEDVQVERDRAVKRIAELDDVVAELEHRMSRQVEEFAAQATSRDAQIRRLRDRLNVLQSSTTFQVGQAVVSGAKHPARAVVTVPRDLARVWRHRRSRADSSAGRPARASADLVVPIALPARDGLANTRRRLTMTAPSHMLVPRKLATEGLARYEASALACYLAAIGAAGPGAVLDVGSNVGIYAALASALTTREVVAFEPTPSLAAVSRRFAADNGLRYRTEAIALGATSGTATFYLSDVSDTSNSLAAGFRQSSQQIQVPVRTLDGYVAGSGHLPAVMKLDTESTEPEVLIGATSTLNQARPWILCEVLANRTESRLMEVMKSFDYHWYHVTDAIPYRESRKITGDPTHHDLMWLFAPERPGEEFWSSLRSYQAALAACTVEAGKST